MIGLWWQLTHVVNRSLEHNWALLSGGGDRHEFGVKFLVHKDMLSAFFDCRPVCSCRISVRLRAAPFNVTVKENETLYLNMMTTRSTASFNNSRNSYTKNLLNVQRNWVANLEGMHRQAREVFVEPTAMPE